MKATITWVSFWTKLIGLLEVIIPAFLLAYIQRLKSQIFGLKGKLALKDRQLIRQETKATVMRKYAKHTDRDVIDSFLSEAPNSPEVSVGVNIDIDLADEGDGGGE